MQGNGESSYRRYLNGDKEAFDRIIVLYKKGLIGFIFRHVGDIDVAEDLSEDCFVELIINPKKFKFKSSLKTYLYGIAHNKVMMYFRRNKTASFISIEDAGELVSSDDTSSEALKAKTSEMINQALLQLPKDYRAVLHFHYFEEMPHEEIGIIMRKNAKQIYNLVFRARNALKNILEKDGFIYEEQ